jgi:hypothetical protein
VLWIRILSDRHHFGGSGTPSESISIQQNVNQTTGTFPESLKTVKNIDLFETHDADNKDKKIKKTM